MDFSQPTTLVTQGNTPTLSAGLIAPVNSQGMRKCKNFTLHIETNSGIPFAFALIYLPQGRDILQQQLLFGGLNNPVSLYEPAQNVIMSGVVNRESPQLTFRTRLARNLNSGDSVVLLLRQLALSNEEVQVLIYAALNYAITY